MEVSLMLYLGIPVIDNHELTTDCLDYLDRNTTAPEGLTVVLIDNNSVEPYFATTHHPYALTVIRNETNCGYYQPLAQLAAMATSADLIALMHNDLFIEEPGWDIKLRAAFLQDPGLGLVGFIGSAEVDPAGGRGGDTKGNFSGHRGQRMEDCGRRIYDLEPALVLDSLFMCFRASVVPLLGPIDEHFQLGHFGDRVWPLRLAEKGVHVGVLGVQCDHMGGSSMANPAWEEDCHQWCLREGITSLPLGISQWQTMLYIEAERRYLTEYRDQKKLIPAVTDGWQIMPTGGLELVAWPHQ